MPDIFERNGWQPAGPAKKLSATASSQRLAIPTNSSMPDIPGKLRVTAKNGASAAASVFLNFGDSTVVAANTDGNYQVDMPLNAIEIIRPPQGATHVAYITDAGTADLTLAPGNGD